MKKRILGKDELIVSEIGFGCMGLNYHRGAVKDKNEMISVVHSATIKALHYLIQLKFMGPILMKK